MESWGNLRIHDQDGAETKNIPLIMAASTFQNDSEQDVSVTTDGFRGTLPGVGSVRRRTTDLIIFQDLESIDCLRTTIEPDTCTRPS